MLQRSTDTCVWQNDHNNWILSLVSQKVKLKIVFILNLTLIRRECLIHFWNISKLWLEGIHQDLLNWLFKSSTVKDTVMIRWMSMKYLMVNRITYLLKKKSEHSMKLSCQTLINKSKVVIQVSSVTLVLSLHSRIFCRN